MKQQWYILGGIGYHGNLLAVFGFRFLVCRVSNFARRYSEPGFESPNEGSLAFELLAQYVSKLNQRNQKYALSWNPISKI